MAESAKKCNDIRSLAEPLLDGDISIQRDWPDFNAMLIFILSVTSYINCIVARCLINLVYLTACCLYQVMMTLHFLSYVANDAEST